MTATDRDTQACPPQDEAAAPASDPQSQTRTSNLLADEALDPAFTDDTLGALAAGLPSPAKQTDEQKQRRQAAAFSALRSFDAQDPAEAMLATHAVLAHHFAMECYRRAARSSQTSNLNTRLLGTAALLTRTMGGLLNALEQRQDEPIWVGPRASP